MSDTKEKSELNTQPDETGNDVEIDLSGLDPALQRRIDRIAQMERSSRQAVLRQILRRALGIKKPAQHS